jgi:hypothetical protein
LKAFRDGGRALNCRILRQAQVFSRSQQSAERKDYQDDANDVAIHVIHPEGCDSQVRLRRKQIFVIQH